MQERWKKMLQQRKNREEVYHSWLNEMREYSDKQRKFNDLIPFFK